MLYDNIINGLSNIIGNAFKNKFSGSLICILLNSSKSAESIRFGSAYCLLFIPSEVVGL